MSTRVKPYPGLTEVAVEITAEAFADADHEIAELERFAAETRGMVVACKPGCAACCTYLVGAVTPEAALAAEHIEMYTDGSTRQEIIARLVAWERLWHQHLGKQTLATPIQAVEWQARRLPCPMLDPTSFTCLIYESRPIACRTHHALPVPENAVSPCTRCEIVQPGQGCFTTQADLAHGHAPIPWQIRNDLLDVYTAGLLTRLLVTDASGDPEPGIHPLLTLQIGRVRYGWKNPPKVVQLPMMLSTHPPVKRQQPVASPV